jgi:hypothetical protein
MWVILVLVGVPVVGVTVMLLLKRMPVKSTPLLVKINVGVSWIAALSILLLVPLDMANTFYAYNNHGSYYPTNNTLDCLLTDSAESNDSIPLHFASGLGMGEEEQQQQHHIDTTASKVLGVCWEVVYWYAFVAMMVLLPFHQEYADSGAFTVWAKVRWSLRQNLLFMLFASALGAFGIFVLIASNRLSVDSLVGFAIAASNALGLCLVLLLLGYGLVELPRKIWRLGSWGCGNHNHNDHRQQTRDRLIYHEIGLQAERTKKAHREVSKCISVVREVTKYFGPRDPLRKFMDAVERTVDVELEAEVFATEDAYPGTACKYDFKLHEEDLEFEYADVHQLGLLRREVRNAQESYSREQSRYRSLLNKAFLQVYQTNVASAASNSYGGNGLGGYQSDGELLLASERASNASPSLQNVFDVWTKKSQSGYAKYLLPIGLRIFSLCLFFLSTCIVLSQLTIYEGLPVWLKRISPLKMFIDLMEPNLTLIQITCLCFLAYILGTCWFSMFKLKVFSIYVMVPEHTPPTCLLMNAMLLCRLTAPIAFNFMMIAMPPTQDTLVDVRQTTFYDEFGEKMLDLSSLGSFLGVASLSFTTFAPTIMLPYMIIVIFNKLSVFSKLCSLCGCKSRKLQFEEFETYGTSHQEDMDYDGVNTEEDALGFRLVEQEHNNFTHGLKLGIALSRYFAEASEKTGWMGRLLNKKSPGSRSTERMRRTNGLREQQQRQDRLSSSSVTEKVKNWFRFATKGKEEEGGAVDNVYEPLRLQQPQQHQMRSSPSSGNNGTATSSSHVSSASKQNVSQNLDNIFRQLR